MSRRFADTFPDPSVIRGRDSYWYAYGTSDPLREGQTRRVLLPIARSRDLVTWTFVEAVFGTANHPRWATRTSSFWAPDIRYFDGSYHLYYVATDTTFTADPFDRAIGVATAPTPAGPWTDSGAPVVGPRGAPGERPLWALDPAQFTDIDGTRYLFYGSYEGGVWVTRLREDGLRAVGPHTRVAISDRYEAPFVVRRGPYYYLFVSSGNCCAGPTSGYSVFVGRATSVRGPFRDAQGVSLNASRVGGSVVVTPNGNRWIGTGHGSIVTDLAGQTWLAYHAIDRRDPFLNEPFGINERPMLLDRLDWNDGWPTVRAGQWASEQPVVAPVTSPAATALFRPFAVPPPAPGTGRHDPRFGDEFAGAALDRQWRWVRSPDGDVHGGRFVWRTQVGNLVGAANTASALLRRMPTGPYTVETRLELDLGENTARDFQQAGLIVYAGDDLFARLSQVAIGPTRQVEYGKEMPFAGRTSYGQILLGPPRSTVWLRITHRTDPSNGEHEFQASMSRNGRRWLPGGVWTMPAETTPQVGLVSHGAAAGQRRATVRFDYFRVYGP
ncbi:MAG: family 43 glycosylhydrolase [Mycobacterium leprae]